MPTYLNLTILALEYIQNFYKTLADASVHAFNHLHLLALQGKNPV